MKEQYVKLLTYIVVLAVALAATPQLDLGRPIKALGNGSVSVVSTEVASSSGGPEVYPGSRNALIVVELVNSGNLTIRNVQGCFIYPEGFTPAGGGSCVNAVSPNGTYKDSYEVGEVFQLRSRVNIGENVSPGTYSIPINVSYTPKGMNRTSEIVYANVTVSPYPPIEIKVIDAWWSSDKVFPGTEGATLNLMIKNVGRSSIEGGIAKLVLPEPLNPSVVRENLPALARNSTTTLTFTNINIPLAVEPGPHLLNIVVNASARTEDGVSYEASFTGKLYVGVEAPKPLNLKVVDAFWESGVAYGESRALTLRLTLQNLEQVTVERVTATLHLPEGVTSREGLPYVKAVFEGPTGYGDVFTITFRGINATRPVSEGLMRAALEVMASYRGAEFLVTQNLSFKARFVGEEVLKLVSQRWVYQGSSARAFPTARGLTLELTLVNLGEDVVASITPSVELPKGFELRSISGSCLAGGVQPGYTCTLNLAVDVGPDIEPGVWKGAVTLAYTTISSGSYMFREVTHPIELPVSDPASYVPVLKVFNVWWGTTTPGTAFAGERRAPLHVEVANRDRYPASDVMVSVAPLTEGVYVVEGNSTCANTLQPGASCASTLYLDLANAEAGSLRVNVSVKYVFSMYGSFIRVSRSLIKELRVEEYAAMLGAEGLKLVDHGWLNDQPVYSGTNDAALTVTLANPYSYSVSSIEAVLKLPKGFSSEGLNVSRAYAPGPVGSGQEVTISFTVSVDRSVEPGTYESLLSVKYVVNTGGAAVSRVDAFTVPVKVDSVGRGLELVSSQWYGGAAEPLSYGRLLQVTLRNAEFPSIRGVVADVKLPKGFVSSITNTSEVRVPPTYAPPATPQTVVQVGTAQATTVQQLAALLAQGAQQSPTSFSRGDIISFLVPVNILDVGPGTYYALMNVSFIDHWGTLRSYTLKVPVVVLGGSKLVDVWALNNLRFERRVGNLTIGVVNIGSAPVYNVYVAVYPTTPYLTVSRSIKYFDYLPPNRVASFNVTTYFNPMPPQGSPVPITYGNIPFMAAVTYVDVNGFRRSFNTSFSVNVEPYIELHVSDVKASVKGGTVRVSGTITNLGNAQVQRVEAYVVVGNKTSEPGFVGDIEPSSQASFSVTAKGVSAGGSVTVVIRYRNPFNEAGEVRVTAPLEVVPEETTTTPVSPGFLGLDMFKVITVVAVALFLVLVGIAIRAFLRRHPAPEIPPGG